MQLQTYTKKEEAVHAITHGFGALLSIVGLMFLIADTPPDSDGKRMVAVLIFGITMFLMYLMSTIVHSLPQGKWKTLFKTVDQAFIYLFIAGTYTPFLLMLLPDNLGKTMLMIVWGIAAAGILLTIGFIKRFRVLSTCCYIFLGWLILFVWGPLTSAMHENGVTLLMTGGLFYTIGTIFYLWRGFCYHHAVWHIFVLMGSGFHFFCIFHYVL
ncbi:hemolysin III family protein [Lentibacillus halophilus]|uniref:Hemolysin III family protein n=1 Tax=Lentibacillus halophilus TaxID=295065 RepID=A0ABP3JAY1_9BACI